MDIFCERLKKLRMEENLTFEQLAKGIKVSKERLKSWETGKSKPKLSYIVAICLYFNVSSDYLVGMKDTKDRKKS